MRSLVLAAVFSLVVLNLLSFSFVDAQYACSVCGGPSYTDIASACSQFSGWSQDCCQCIVQHESGGDLHACNKNNDGSIDAGLWQINTVNWSSCSGGNPPCDLGSNLACAQKVFGWGGNTWRFWSTCSACGCCSRA